uniref:Biliverdin reductase B n=1 Tax=Dromaius novaehollandiae TaxID=8790 RepID=A0A8C4K7M9_DRONO|nr:flavin reductase (NADPH) [Dromaius novaehollandiae]
MATCKNIAIFGATGMTGLATLAQALDAGYNVTVLVRDPARLPPEHRPARVVVGDVLNPADVDKAVQGQDAVIVILGTRNDLSRAPRLGAPADPGGPRNPLTLRPPHPGEPHIPLTLGDL